jgi:hypothetical protein
VDTGFGYVVWRAAVAVVLGRDSYAAISGGCTFRVTAQHALVDPVAGQ